MSQHHTFFQPMRAILRSRQTGVLLLEVLISVLIFSFAILGLVGLQARAIQFSVDAEDRNRAALLTNEIVTTMWLHGATDTGQFSADFDAWKDRLGDASAGGLPGGDGTIGSGGLITVTWAPINGSAERKYVTKVSIPVTEQHGSAPDPEGGESEGGAEQGQEP